MEVAARDRTGGLLRALDRNEKQRRALDAEMVRLLAELDDEWVDDPMFPDLAPELAARQGISAHTAWERIRISTALRELPEISRAHAEGRLSWDQLRWLTRFATPETDEHWAERAPEWSPNRLKLESERQARLSRLRAERDHAARGLWMAWDEERRFLELQGTLAAEQGAAFEAAIEQAAQQVEVEDEVEDRGAARRADALVGLVTSAGGRQQPATLVVHADAELLSSVSDGTRQLGETPTGVQLTSEAIRRIACDSKVRVALERDGSPVGLVTLGRAVTEQQIELLVFRDRHCRFPGCERTLFVHAHHIRHWADGGRTTLENLTLLCGAHHRRLHEGGWTIRGRPPDGLEFVDRWGRVRRGIGPALARAG